VSDFGFARLLQEDGNGRTSSDMGPIRWMAPECFSMTYSVKSDVWSWSCLLLELFTKNKPYPELELLKVATLVRDNQLSPALWLQRSGLKLPPWATEAISQCSHFNPTARPSFPELIDLLASRFIEAELLSKKKHVDRFVEDLNFL
jgi:serine/threonine protein kinase